MHSLKRWLSRLSFSMLILGLLCLWTAYKMVENQGWEPKVWVWTVSGIGLMLVGLIGVRYRHDRNDY